MMCLVHEEADFRSLSDAFYSNAIEGVNIIIESKANYLDERNHRWIDLEIKTLSLAE